MANRSAGSSFASRKVARKAAAQSAAADAEAPNYGALQTLNRAHSAFRGLNLRRETFDVERQLDELEQRVIEVVRDWGEAVESRLLFSEGHCERVAQYSCTFAQAVGIFGRDLSWLRVGAFVHDVGMAAIPADLLNRSGPLTSNEWLLVKSHTLVGEELVAQLDFPPDVREMVRSHHERWDGLGYPDGLAGEEIPLSARILKLADVFETLTRTRSYARAVSPAVALEIMAADAGRELDPILFAKFRSLLLQGGLPGVALA